MSPFCWLGWVRSLACVGVLLAGFLVQPFVHGAESGPVVASVVRIDETVTVTSTGDCQVVTEIRLSPEEYAAMKSKKSSMDWVLRHYGVKGPAYSEVADVKPTWDDEKSMLTISRTVKGMTRLNRNQEWETWLPNGVKITPKDNPANVVVVAEKHGQVWHRSRVVLPEASSGVHAAETTGRLAYSLPTSSPKEGKLQTQFRLEVQPTVLGCLAKAYANPELSDLWVARTVMSNTGEQSLTNYRVRFRIPGHTLDWSSWQSCPQVVGGQTVVDAFFPLFDLDKMARMEGNATVAVEVEMEYTRIDGVVVKETTEKRFTLLGHNQVRDTSFVAQDVRGAADWNLLPCFVAAFADYHDPVMQEVAGRLCNCLNGIDVKKNDEEALKFVKALYMFMDDNLAYQIPPGEKAGGRYSQHVKYGREVLRNRAGTCIDLALFFASVCEAVGLETELVLPDGHCYPVVVLPSGQKLAVETTCIRSKTFEKAVKLGSEELAEDVGKTSTIVVKPREWHAKGVWGPDLPALPTDVLEKWSIRFAPKP